MRSIRGESKNVRSVVVVKNGKERLAVSAARAVTDLHGVAMTGVVLAATDRHAGNVGNVAVSVEASGHLISGEDAEKSARQGRPQRRAQR